jgi:hypothetical protein
LALLRRQGLQAWITLCTAEAVTVPSAKSSTTVSNPSIALVDPKAKMPADMSPLLDLCTNMLLSKLTSTKHQELQ